MSITEMHYCYNLIMTNERDAQNPEKRISKSLLPDLLTHSLFRLHPHLSFALQTFDGHIHRTRMSNEGLHVPFAKSHA